MQDDERRRAWERAAMWPLTIAALAFLAAYAWPILDPDLPPTARDVAWGVTVVTWALFVVDYAARLWLAGDRWHFVRTHLLDLAVVLLPLLRPLQLLRLVTLLAILNRTTRGGLRGHVALYVGSATTLILLASSLAILETERGVEGSTIEDFGDALWWSFATVTTVGYGDSYPVTSTGRLIAVGLMMLGIALLGVVTASLASWLLDRVSEVEDASRAATRRDIDTLREELRELRAALDVRGGERPEA